MKDKRHFRLLTKTTFVYLCFTFFAFFFSAFFLSHEADEFIKSNLNHKFNRHESRIVSYLNKHEIKSYSQHNAIITQLTTEPNWSSYPSYNDTMVFNEESQREIAFRTRTNVKEINNKYYKIEILKPVEDYYSLRDDIFNTLIPSFIILSMTIVLFNLFLSGYFFKPFNAIMNQMKSFKIGHSSKIEKVNTTTAEFHTMQNLFSSMLDKIEADYRGLKEYTEDMAHEMQTPLAIMRNKIENMISDPDVMEKSSSEIQTIYSEINHLTNLGSSLNLLTKIGNREFVNRETLHTKEILEKHIESVIELANLKTLDIVSDLSAEHTMDIDPLLFDVLIKNLIKNAINYSEKNGLVQIVSDKDKLEITNQGKQPEIDVEKIFDRFSHSPSSKKSLGLGLAIAKKICDTNGLTISYSYHDGKNKFTISDLPV